MGLCAAAVGFYANYHGHTHHHLQAVYGALQQQQQARRPTVFLVGDSSLDNKYWLFNADSPRMLEE